MNSQQVSLRSALIRGVSFAVVLTLFGGLAASASTGGNKKKPLSLTSITVNGAFNSADFGQIWMAARAGYFKQYGITNVNLLNTSLSGAASAAVLIAGASQFVVAGNSSLIQTDQAGGNVRAVAALDYGSTEEVAITQTAAVAHGIPLTATTPAQAKAQLLAMKGSHINIAVSTTGSDGLTYLAALLRFNGLTYDTQQGGSADVNIVPTGSVPNAVVAVQSGKDDGIATTPPNTVITSPPTIVVPLHLLAPADKSFWAVVCTSSTVIGQHPDTVQAFLNGLVEANHFAKTHPQRAFKLYSDMMNASGITSPEEIQYLWAANHIQWPNLVPTRTGFAKAISLINEAGLAPVTVTYPQFVDNRFALKAYKVNKLPVPTTI